MADLEKGGSATGALMLFILESVILQCSIGCRKQIYLFIEFLNLRSVPKEALSDASCTGCWLVVSGF